MRAESYDVEQRFGADRIHPTRHLLFEELERWLAARDVSLRDQVASVCDVGCSLGYVLHYLETDLLRAPQRLVGVDIDEQAIAEGRRHLEQAGSNVELHAADMDGLASIVGEQRFDLFLCCGVLMYTRSEQALEIVRTMLRHGRFVAISGLAHPEVDNATLEQAATRERDGTFIHNVDALVTEAGGRVLERRWDGAKKIDGNTVYFVLATAESA